MKSIGVVNLYNGKYGTILTKENEIVDFEFKDISFGQKINIGDIVEFRIDQKFPDIKLARNINPISSDEIYK